MAKIEKRNSMQTENFPSSSSSVRLSTTRLLLYYRSSRLLLRTPCGPLARPVDTSITLYARVALGQPAEIKQKSLCRHAPIHHPRPNQPRRKIQ